jgi:poly(A) polymerase
MRQSLRVSNAEADEMAEALGGLDALLADLEPTLARKKRFLAGEHSGASLKILEALGALKIYPQRVAMLREELARLASEDVAPPPLLVGDDLIAEGLKPGPVFKRILDAAYDAQLEGRVSSRQAAMELAKGLAKQA